MTQPDTSPTTDTTKAADATDAADATSLTFEQARDALVQVVERLQSGTDSLQESLDLWERGERLAQRCEEFLAEARARVERVVAQTRGAETGVRDGAAVATSEDPTAN